MRSIFNVAAAAVMLLVAPTITEAISPGAHNDFKVDLRPKVAQRNRHAIRERHASRIKSQSYTPVVGPPSTGNGNYTDLTLETYQTPSGYMTVLVCVKQPDAGVASLNEIIQSVSDPTSSQYGQWLTNDEVGALIMPDSDTVNNVTSYLNSVGATDLDWTIHYEFVYANLPLSMLATVKSRNLTETQQYIDIILGVDDLPQPVPYDDPNISPLNPEGPTPLVVGASTDEYNAVMYINLYCPNGTQADAIWCTTTTMNSTTNVTTTTNTTLVNVTGIFDYMGIFPNVTVTAPAMYVLETGSFPIQTLPAPYQPFMFGVWATFSDGLVTDTFYYPGMIYPSPVSTPEMLKKLYDIPSDMRITNPLVNNSVYESIYEFIVPTDLPEFLTFYGVAEPGSITYYNNFANNSEYGGYLVDGAGGESSLDIQQISSIAPGASNSARYVVSRISPNFTEESDVAGFMEFLVTLVNTSDIESVISISYGDVLANYADADGSLNGFYRLELEWLKTVIRGTTVLVAAGDQGSSDAIAGDDKDTCLPLSSDYPCSSAWILCVGATMVTPFNERFDSYMPVESEFPVPDVVLGEIVSSVGTGALITSGGGFSSWVARPWWQPQSVIDTYLTLDAQYRDFDNLELPNLSQVNTSGRAVPDVTASGHSYAVLTDGEFGFYDGTSCSTPVWGGVITLLNAERIQNGMPVLGFANPFIYWAAQEDPTAFNDITFGNNDDAETYNSKYQRAPVVCSTGYSATPGWDAASGWGSPSFRRLKDLALNVPGLSTTSTSSASSTSSNSNTTSSGASSKTAAASPIFGSASLSLLISAPTLMLVLALGM